MKHLRNIGIIAILLLAVLGTREVKLGVSEDLKLKVPHDKIKTSKIVKDIRCNTPYDCQDYGNIKKYYYEGAEITGKKASDVLSDEELLKHGIDPNSVENINKRENKKIVFENGNKATYVFSQGDLATKNGNKWYEIKSATTTIEAYNQQLGFLPLAYATDFTPTGRVDGYVRNTDPTYSTAQGAATGNAVDDNGGTMYVQNAYDESSPVYVIDKIFTVFDTSSLSGEVDTASFKCYGAYKVANAGNDSYRLVQTTPSSVTALATSDFNQSGTTAGATDITIAGFTNGDWNTWTMNATGESWIDVDGDTKLGLRSVLDIAATQPGNPDDAVGCEQVEDTNAPTLTVTVIAPEVEAGEEYLIIFE